MLEKYINEQKIATKILINSIKENKVSHAYIIETNKYKNTDDFISCMLTDILNNKDLYNTIKDNNYPDIRIIQTNNLQYKKEEILNLQKEFQTKALFGKYKIYVIKEANKLNPYISNSILKFIEEPEEGIISILVVENKFQLIKTIISRCQVITLNNNVRKNKNIEEFFLMNNFKYNSYEDIKNLIDNVIKFSICLEKYKKNCILYENKYFGKYFKTKEDYYVALEILKLIYIQTLNNINNLKIEYLNDYQDIINKISLLNNKNVVIKKINVIIETQKNLNYNLNLNLLLDELIIKLGEC